MSSQYFKRWKFLQQLAEADTGAKTPLHGLAGLSEEKGIKTQLKKGRRRGGVRKIHTRQFLENGFQLRQGVGPARLRRIESWLPGFQVALFLNA